MLRLVLDLSIGDAKRDADLIVAFNIFTTTSPERDC